MLHVKTGAGGLINLSPKVRSPRSAPERFRFGFRRNGGCRVVFVHSSPPKGVCAGAMGSVDPLLPTD